MKRLHPDRSAEQTLRDKADILREGVAGTMERVRQIEAAPPEQDAEAAPEPQPSGVTFSGSAEPLPPGVEELGLTRSRAASRQATGDARPQTEQRSDRTQHPGTALPTASDLSDITRPPTGFR